MKEKYFLRIIVWLAALLTMSVVVFMVGYILIKGIPAIKPSLFEMEYNSVNVSLMPALINTLIITFCSLLIAVPIGIGAAIYLVEYASRGNRLVKLVRVTAETLSGIPSIVYGLFGYLFFVIALHWGNSILAGICTLAIMILPLIMRTAEEALISVPDTFREGSFGLGAGRLRTVFKVVLPSAVPGIMSGVILGIGRIVGESAALIYTAGGVEQIAKNAFDSSATLSVHMYLIASEGLHVDESYGTAVVLLVIVIIINAISGFIGKKIARKAQ